MMLLQTKPCKRVTPEKKGEPPPASPVSGGQWAERARRLCHHGAPL